MKKMTDKGQSVCKEKAQSLINLYPHDAGKSFPAIANACGSISTGNIIPDSMVDGRKSRIEIMDVFALSFTASPIVLATLSETAIRTTSPPKYVPGRSGSFASKRMGAAA